MKETLGSRSRSILNYLYMFVGLDIPEGGDFPRFWERAIFQTVFDEDEREFFPMLRALEKLRNNRYITHYRKQDESYYRLTKKDIRYVEENAE